MYKKLLYLYIPFVLYSMVSFFLPLSQTIDLMTLFTFENDLLLVMVFNMLGVFPMLFLLILFKYEKQAWYVYVLFFLGFMLGGFVLLPGVMLLKEKPKTQHTLHKLLSVLLPLILIVMLIVGILFGDFSLYIDAFMQDRFVHIMTIDLFVLILTPYVLGYISWPFLNFTKWLWS